VIALMIFKRKKYSTTVQQTNVMEKLRKKSRAAG
jgi:hypothetical protein